METILGSRFQKAFLLASRYHAQQTRKGTAIPYLSHLLGVTSLVLDAGGDEDEAIAAMLHDAVEDQGGGETLAEIEAEFGKRVAGIVEGCSDTFVVPKPPWRPRKEAYLKHLPQASAEVVKVSLADKLQNARSIARDLELFGEDTWRRFTGGKEGSIWYYQSLVRIFRQISPSVYTEELAEIVSRWK